ncbi:hypothetical protein KIW84_UN0386 [Lathyrus oleraceus]|nr:hypothetical protein KIW84_UN0386 [Pisum sativum]
MDKKEIKLDFEAQIRDLRGALKKCEEKLSREILQREEAERNCHHLRYQLEEATRRFAVLESQEGNTALALLAIAYGNSSDSEEDDQSDSDIAVDGDDLNTINHPLESKSQESPCLPSQFQGCQAAIPPVPVEVCT